MALAVSVVGCSGSRSAKTGRDPNSGGVGVIAGASGQGGEAESSGRRHALLIANHNYDDDRADLANPRKPRSRSISRRSITSGPSTPRSVI